MKLYYFQGADKLVEYPEGIISMRACKVKPFPTCETCPYEPDCERTVHKDTLGTWNNDEQYNINFCSRHPDFGGNNGKNM